MHAFSEILITPPAVGILRIDERPAEPAPELLWVTWELEPRSEAGTANR